MSRWTDEQKTAILAENCSVIVSAAAGSGKTSVLVERLTRIIADKEKHIPVEKMIVVTFTRDAASEMKQRLGTALSQLLERSPDDRWLSRQEAMLGSAAISTISSFCIELLRRNICLLPFSSGFRIADDTEEAVFRAAAYKTASDIFYSQRREDMMLLRRNFCGTDDAPLQRLICELYECVSSVPFFDRWLDDALKMYDGDAYEKAFADNLKGSVEECSALFDAAGKAVKMLDNQKVSEMFESEQTAFLNALELFESRDLKGFSQKLSDINFQRFPRIKPDDDAALKDEVMGYRNAYKDLIGDIIKKTSILEYADEDMGKSREILTLVSDFLKLFSRELMREKEKKNAIGFDDAEKLVLNLLAKVSEDGSIEKTPLAHELSEFYELIMIDEFQDSNNRQDMIFRLLSKGGTAENYGRNLFFVGDVKQSIYRFRLANPGNFIAALDSSVPYQKGNTRLSSVRLNRNFRSCDEVINFTNYIFGSIMSKDCGDIDYNEQEYLYRGAAFSDSDRTPVIMMFNRDDALNAEAECVAEKIASMIDGKVPVSANGGKSSRPCEMRDFCILMRNNKNIRLYADELAKLGISSDCSGESGYLQAREVAVMLNILRVIDNPLLDTPLMSVMLSPMFMFTPDDAAEIRLIDKKAAIYRNILRGIGSDKQKPLLQGELLDKSRLLISCINEFRLYSGACDLRSLISKIYDRTDFMSVMQLYGSAQRKKANLRLLLEYAGNYDKNSDGGLSGFIRYIDSVIESGGDFEAAPDTRGSKNSVAIKSMHKSKGLEFPFVFIVGTDTKFNAADTMKPFRFSYEKGLGFRLQNPDKFIRYPSLPFEVIDNANRLEYISEEMRLLYVAMTRAKERLFITLDMGGRSVKNAVSLAKKITVSQGITPSAAASAGSMSDWILMCLMSHQKSAPLREKLGVLECFRYKNDFNIEYLSCKPSEKTADEVKTVGERAKADELMIKRLKDMFSFNYDLTLSAITSKLTVTELLSSKSGHKTTLRTPNFAVEDKPLTPAQKGTAMHAFLQYADLSRDIESEKERLCTAGFLTQKQADSIKNEDVDAFKRSDIAKRMKNAVKIHREKKFLIYIDELGLGSSYGADYVGTKGLINGIIDMVIEYSRSLVLVDYKTDHVSDISELEDKYKGQLLIYKRAIERIMNKPVTEALIYSFHKKAELKLDI